MMMPKMRSVFTEPETSEDVCFSHGSNHGLIMRLGTHRMCFVCNVQCAA